jgi:hypothetical protein
MWKAIQTLVAFASAMLLSFSVHATSVIPAATVTELTTNGTDSITAIGGGMLSLGVVAVLFKWAKAALFG